MNTEPSLHRKGASQQRNTPFNEYLCVLYAFAVMNQ